MSFRILKFVDGFDGFVDRIVIFFQFSSSNIQFVSSSGKHIRITISALPASFSSTSASSRPPITIFTFGKAFVTVSPFSLLRTSAVYSYSGCL